MITIDFGSLTDWFTAGSTVAIALLTIFLWNENRLLRNAGSRPHVVAFLKPHSDGTGGVDFVLANVGAGPAFEVKYNFECDKGDFNSHDVLLLNDADRMPINVLPQGESIRALFGIGFKLYGKVNGEDIGPMKPFSVNLIYKNSAGKSFSDSRVIDIRQFAGVPGIVSQSNVAKMSKILEKMEGHLSTISRQSGRFSAFVDVSELRNDTVRKVKGESSD